MTAGVTITSRLRSNAAIHEPAPPPTGKQGRPRKWGQRLPRLARIALDPATQWTAHAVRRYRRTETLMLHTIDCLWGPLGAQTPIRVILVQDAAKSSGYQIALITTDLDASAAQIVERYTDRWPIEVCSEEGKEPFGVGDARNRARKAVERTVPFQFLAMNITRNWYAPAGHHPDVVAEHRARSPWSLTKTTPSFADMHANLRRVIIATQCHPGQTRTTTPAKSSRSSKHGQSPGMNCESRANIRYVPKLPPRGRRAVTVYGSGQDRAASTGGIGGRVGRR
ncbi:MAG: hypothetical protein ACYC91_11990 [Solirubrobacteraceae bacterium]